MTSIHNVHVSGLTPLIAPDALCAEQPTSAAAAATVLAGRETVVQILTGVDRRLLVVVGPCSIHDERAALEYADRLRALAAELSDRLFVVMRVYFEKPRTTVGWKGLINDPHLDGSFDIEEGLRRARRILITVNERGLPAATEMLDPITPQYTADLISWASIGARTTESQTHRQMASGLSMPIGYKNATNGDLQAAIDAMLSGRSPHAFLGIDEGGRSCIVNTTGNPWGHLILRGGHDGPNHDADSIARALARLEKAGLPTGIVVDCSHANSRKDYTRQGIVFRNVLTQRLEGNANLIGMMIESNLHEGSQTLGANPLYLDYGVSITDGCIGFRETEELLREAHAALPVAEPATSAS